MPQELIQATIFPFNSLVKHKHYCTVAHTHAILLGVEANAKGKGALLRFNRYFNVEMSAIL